MSQHQPQQKRLPTPRIIPKSASTTTANSGSSSTPKPPPPPSQNISNVSMNSEASSISTIRSVNSSTHRNTYENDNSTLSSIGSISMSRSTAANASKQHQNNNSTKESSFSIKSSPLDLVKQIEVKYISLLNIFPRFSHIYFPAPSPSLPMFHIGIVSISYTPQIYIKYLFIQRNWLPEIKR